MIKIIVTMLIYLVVPLASMAGAPGFLQERMGTLSGQVLDENGTP